ncbi:MAG: ABC transporter substrate-binding protein [Alphaproteobacteria bacterium]|nr:ABC transporter substrate-binding protein [Alphaproteobacteria bacterium]
MAFHPTRRDVLALPVALATGGVARAGDWSAIVAEASGQEVYFNAWAGSPTINAYIGWVAEEVARRWNIVLHHVKITDAAETVRRVRDEVGSGTDQGSVDLVWINGENFLAMKRDRLLFGPFAEALPNFALVDTLGKPTTQIDFAEPVEGFESPWGMAQLTFFGDGARVGEPPLSLAALTDFAAAHGGRVSYPAPPDFHGTTFIKQVLAETLSDHDALGRPVTAAEFDALVAPAFAALDGLHPHLWREGKQFPASQAALKQMLADGELLMALTFNPNEPANLVAAGELPVTTIAWQHGRGTIGNTHFVAIPVNARTKAGAQVVANFLLSPEAQARKADLSIWGDPTVLALDRLTPDERALFTAKPAPGSVSFAAPAIPEPHGSFVALIEAAWLSRYGG